MDLTSGLGPLLLVAVAGMLGGAINAAVGAGTLVVFSALTSLGFAPVVANGTNTTGLFPGSFSATLAYRSELANRMRVLAWPLVATTVMAAVGASLVVLLPDKVFGMVVPWLILSATALVVVQPGLNRLRLSSGPVRPRKDLPLWTGLVGIYGGYFGAGQGVMLMAALGLRYDANIQHANAAKNLLSATANAVAAAVFIIAGRVDFTAAVAIGVGAIVGGYVGGRWTRRLPAWALRALVIAIGILGAVVVFVRY